ncbi:helix-turn-helix transcriptional regulator [Riemerella anatipestifer]|uniref:helix-turn-helix domain-containing protein n=1 Tax=Riemerella anatipestifer TaxID=34085 RepID=UPI001374B324|nr:helix-turn-helix transcriptional regulator [Riemerella anatipestifer]MDY3339018.1 helix-turn-helix transcriptional regulator [Riemerella anatipestifer]MDY3521070.1 helix-turn-helix transcriptional regulator [Riemerella anatipestifer]MDY3533169.1 helix-turn-helix transcriptional regulator [Riemerella anatipestifer]MDY3535365.1 helix-turn-helix transcriptional regulator [Riemerella anatipestifer]
MDKQELQIKIGKRVRQLRESKNISQVDLASACNFEKSNMSRIEAGKTCPNIFTLYKIAKNLEVPITELIEVVN